MDSLIKWNNRTTDTTYDDFQKFIQSEYHALDAVGGLTVGNSALNQANAVKELKDHQETQFAQLRSEMNTTMEKAFNMAIQQENIPPSYGTSYEFTPPPPPGYESQISTVPPTYNPLLQQQMLYSANQQDTLRQALQPLQQMQNRMDQMQHQLQNLHLINGYGQSSGYNGGDDQGGGNKDASNSDINPKTRLPWKRYCWTCGCCSHWGKNCPNKKKGHKNEATFRNRMGGSNKNCR